MAITNRDQLRMVERSFICAKCKLVFESNEPIQKVRCIKCYRKRYIQLDRRQSTKKEVITK